MNTQYVIKTDGKTELLNLNKIKNKINFYISLAEKYNKNFNKKEIDIQFLLDSTIDNISNNIQTYKINEIIIEKSLINQTKNYNYYRLASISSVYESFKNTPVFSESVNEEKNFLFDYKAIEVLKSSYIQKDIKGNLIESPQGMYGRICERLSKNKEEFKELYDLLSNHKFTFATPILQNLGTKSEQLFSCFLLQVAEDSLEGISKTLHDCWVLLKNTGGVGLSISNIRSKHSPVGTKTTSTGVIPFLKVFESATIAINNRRRSALAVYCDIWHADVLDVINMRLDKGDHNLRVRNLFNTLWINNCFMDAVIKKEKWYLFDPAKIKPVNLQNLYGEKFKKKYYELVDKKLYDTEIEAQEVWNLILSSLLNSGTPYCLFSDNINNLNNQVKPFGTIKTSNLCFHPKEKIKCYLKNDEEYSKVTLNFKSVKDIIDKGVNIYTDTIDIKTKKITKTKIKRSFPTVKTKKILLLKIEREDVWINSRSLHYDNFSIKCTPDHKFLVDSDNGFIYKEAKNLTKSDSLITSDLHNQDADHKIKYTVNDISELDYKNNMEMWDLEVESDNHNFLLISGIFVHNCSEITEYTEPNKSATCNLASLSLPSFVDVDNKKVDYANLYETTKKIIKYMDRIIDINEHKVENTKENSNKQRALSFRSFRF